ncbi:TasA family protein [Halorientalis regularis]|uniref:SipW-cognate class signal peptide n=1 Tax=Halorientalis regularis TaxID=660518 RepID=A0A1G7JU85_9EURY|nr:TasA family protein [Halorientalis regularis]SDF28468.1 SipW-cognate class signal peptide [Halorientalis regularis]
MTDNNPKLYDLSRRKMLAGLGAVGLASVGAGLGTSAYFSDTESFSNNSLTAGTLDMSVSADVVAANQYWMDQGGLDISVVADSQEPVFGLQVDDIKPGDWAIVCFEISVGDNPGYVQVATENFAQSGGVNPEPEQAEEGDANNDADLGAALLTTVWQSYDDSGDRAGLSTLDPVFNNASDLLTIDYAEPDEDGVAGLDAHYTNAVEADGVLSGGYIVKDDTGVPMLVGSDSDGTDSEVADTYEFCLLLELPYEVGNEIQGDGISFDLVFETEQVRNNDTPFANQTNSTSQN